MNNNLCNVCRVGTLSLSQFTLDKAVQICDNKDCTFIFETLPEDLVVDHTICSQQVLDKLDFLTYRKSRQSQRPASSYSSSISLISENEMRASFGPPVLPAYTNSSQSNPELDELLDDIFSTATNKTCDDIASSQIETPSPQNSSVREETSLNISCTLSNNSQNLVVEMPMSSPVPEKFVDQEGNTYVAVDMTYEELMKHRTDESTMESGCLVQNDVLTTNLPSFSPTVSCRSSDSGFDDMDACSTFSNEGTKLKSPIAEDEGILDDISKCPLENSSMDQQQSCDKQIASTNESVTKTEKSHRRVTFSSDVKIHDIPSIDDAFSVSEQKEIPVITFDSDDEISLIKQEVKLPATKEVRVCLKRLREDEIEHACKRRALGNEDTPVPEVIEEKEPGVLTEQEPPKILKSGRKRGRPKKNQPRKRTAKNIISKPPAPQRKRFPLEPEIVEKVKAQLRFAVEQEPNVSSLIRVTVNGQLFMCRPLS